MGLCDLKQIAEGFFKCQRCDWRNAKPILGQTADRIFRNCPLAIEAAAENSPSAAPESLVMSSEGENDLEPQPAPATPQKVYYLPNGKVRQDVHGRLWQPQPAKPCNCGKKD